MQSDPKIFYRRRLPHYQPPNETFHGTFRLAGSLPNEAVLRLTQERDEFKQYIQRVESVDEQRRLRREWEATYFNKFDELLDSSTSGPLWLQEDAVAEKVSEILRSRDGIDLDLLAFCLMPNHVHLLTTVGRSSDRREESGRQRNDECTERTEVRSTIDSYILTDVLRSVKGVSARECNKLLHRSGRFWQHESYDHVIRDDAELERTIWYILNNPVKAGLCKCWRDWKWSYVKEGLIDL